MCQNHSVSSCAKAPINSTNYALEQALLGEDVVQWDIQRLLIVEALDAGAQVNHPVEHAHGNILTALYVAVINRDTELIAHLMQKGANPNLDLYDNGTIFSYVDSVDVAQQLISCGAPIVERAGAMFGGLLHGLMQPSPETIELMEFYLEQGANPNLPDWSGDTPLHVLSRSYSSYAMHEQLFKIKVNVLFKAGADQEAKNSAGKTPLELLQEKSNHQVIGFY